MHSRMRKFIRLVKFVLVGILFAILLFWIRNGGEQLESSEFGRIYYTLMFVSLVVGLVIIYLREPDD